MEAEGVHCQHFDHLVQYQLAICKRCKYAVWPDQVESHLQRSHRVARNQAHVIAEEVRSWPGLIQYPSELQIPEGIIQSLVQLPLYSDGWKCEVEPTRCQHIVRSKEVMRKHWRICHSGWSAAVKPGRPNRTRAKTVQERIGDGCRRVHCQRFFSSRHGSRYFEVQAPVQGQEGAPEPIPTDSQTAWAQVGERMAQAWETVRKQAETVIQDGEKDEINPWLERTGWLPYLIDMKRPELLACVEEPNSDPNQDEEPVEAAIWEAMDGLVRFSQASVIHRTGVFVRLEAIRTEKHQTRFQPLQPYMDEKSIVEHSRPWKQMLMFFARTQREHTWKSPRYRFTRRQREAWEELVKQAERQVGRDVGEEVDDEMEEEFGDEIEEVEEEMEDDVEEVDDEGVNMNEEGENQNQGSHEPRRLTRIQKACLQFCIQLLNQSITRQEYDSPLVCALAVLGVKETGWKGPEQYPPILSAVIKVARFMVVQQALEWSEPSREAEFEGDSAYESDGGGRPPPKGCLQFVQEMMDKFMVRGSHGPMQWMLDLRTYGLKIHYHTTSRGHVEWVGQDELLYKHLHFTMRKFRGMVHGLVAETRRLLMEELLFVDGKAGDQAPPIPWQTLRDDPTNGQPGWNFLRDHRTRMPVEGETWLFEQVGRKASIRERFSRPESASGVDRKEVERYMGRVVEYREKLMVAMLMMSQPARAPEMFSIRHTNTVKGEHRNVFIEDGMVVFVTRYHKGYSVSGDPKVIHRYLPREVGELVVWYLWLVLPFQQRLEAMVWERKAMSSHMWPADPSGRKWTSERLRNALKRESRVGLGQELTIQSYREVAIGISRKFMRGSTAFASEEGEENEEWKEENAAGTIADEQAGHTPHIAGLIYARGIMEQAGAVADKRQRFRASSTDWHRFLGFPSAVEDGHPCKKRKRAPFESEADEGRMERWGRLRKMDAAGPLERMMGKTARFRGVQKEAIEAIVAGESPVVAVMPTGAGKSMLFMLPAWAEQGGTTVVVVPLVSLRGDMMRRCQQLGMSCAAWEGRHPPDAAAVVLVTPESAVGEDFMTFLNRLKATRQLDRIVIDECHVVLNRRYTFRKRMQQLGRLAAAQTQMVLLTATLPPSEEDELFRRMHFERGQVKMFREATTRTNVAYRVVRVGRRTKREEVQSTVVRMVQQKLREYRTGKVIVYGNSKPKVRAVAESLGCQAYHADAVGRASMLAEFMAGKQRMIVATSALGMGVDIADVRCIIHMDWPFSVLEYAQESGRAGRDGLRSEAIMIAQEGDQRVDEQQSEAEQQLVRAYVEGEGEGGMAKCRRVVLDGYLDGRGDRVGCEEREEMCDVCRGMGGQAEEGAGEEGEGGGGREDDNGDGEGGMDMTEREQGEARGLFEQQERERRGPWHRLTEHRQGEFADMEWVRRQLAWWAGRCGICEAAGDGPSGHDIRQCWRAESGAAKEMVKRIDREIRFDSYSGCYGCGGVPQEICNGWEADGKGLHRRVAGGDCQYKGVLAAGLIGIVVGYEEVGMRWDGRLRELGLDGSGPGRMLMEYLGKKQSLETVESNHLVGEFCWVTRLLAE